MRPRLTAVSAVSAAEKKAEIASKTTMTAMV
jgi:hypothetical protein